MIQKGRPVVPCPTPASQPFWEGCKRHELLIQTCQECGHKQWFPRMLCGKCMSENLGWAKASGKAKVYSYTIIHRPPVPDIKFLVPYVLALVELDEGIRLLSNIVGCNHQDVRIGLPVQVDFEYVSPEISLPVFRPLIPS